MPTQLTTEQIIIANNAFPHLDGFWKAVGEKPILVPYKFTDETRKKLRKWKRAFKAVCDDYEESRVAKVKEISPVNEDITKESSAIQKQFQGWGEVQMKETHDFDLPLIDRDTELLFENKNPIPDSVLEALECICKPEEAPAPKEKLSAEGGE